MSFLGNNQKSSMFNKSSGNTLFPPQPKKNEMSFNPLSMSRRGAANPPISVSPFSSNTEKREENKSIGIFGSKSTNTPSAFNSGGNNSGTGKGLFSQSTNAGSSILNKSSNSGGMSMFNKPALGSGIFQSGSQNASTGLFQSTYSPYGQIDQTEMHKKELEEFCKTYSSIIDPSSALNEFRACMYNKFSKKTNLYLKEQIKNMKPVKDIMVISEKGTANTNNQKQIEVFVNQRKYAQARKENPDPDSYYVKQVNSYEELYQRLVTLQQTAKNVTESMKAIKKKMESMEESSKFKLKQGLKTLKENMKVIRARVLTVQSKMNMIANSTTYSVDDWDKLDKVYEETREFGKLHSQLDQVQTKLETVTEKESYKPMAASEAFDKMNPDEKRRTITIMREQMKGVASLVEIVKSNAYKLDVMESIVVEAKNQRERDLAFQRR